ncbi:hypothetical protein BaRGS_00025552, partial [Batillaria attramentaria]
PGCSRVIDGSVLQTSSRRGRESHKWGKKGNCVCPIQTLARIEFARTGSDRVSLESGTWSNRSGSTGAAPPTTRPPSAPLTCTSPFYNTLTHPMANTLREMGVGVWGHVVPVHPTVVRQLSSVSAEGDSDDNFNDCSDDVDVRRREGSRKVETTVDDDLVVDGETDADREGDRFIFQCRLCDNEDNDLEDDGDIELEHSGVRPRFAVARGGSSARYRSHLCPVSDSDTASDEPRSVCDAVGVGAGFGDVHTSTVPEYGVVRGGAGGMSAAAGDEDNEIIATSACDNSTAIEGNNAMFVSPRHPSCHASGTAGLTSRRGAPPVGASDVTPVAMTTGRRDDVWRSRSDSWRVCESLLPCLSRLLSHPPDFTDFEVKVAGFRDKVLDQQAAEEREKPSPARTPKVPARDGAAKRVVFCQTPLEAGRFLPLQFLPGALHSRCVACLVVGRKPARPHSPGCAGSLVTLSCLCGKRQLVCRTALADFQSILDLLGGPRERQRAAELLNAVEIVDDQVSARAACLRPKGKVKDRSKVIFGTGDALKAVTVTANSGFIRAAKNQGISFAVHLHPARALTELKEATATPL